MNGKHVADKAAVILSVIMVIIMVIPVQFAAAAEAETELEAEISGIRGYTAVIEEPENGTVVFKDNKSSESCIFETGENVKVSVHADEGYACSHIEVGAEDGTVILEKKNISDSFIFNMPGQNVIISADFAEDLTENAGNGISEGDERDDEKESNEESESGAVKESDADAGDTGNDDSADDARGGDSSELAAATSTGTESDSGQVEAAAKQSLMAVSPLLAASSSYKITVPNKSKNITPGGTALSSVTVLNNTSDRKPTGKGSSASSNSQYVFYRDGGYDDGEDDGVDGTGYRTKPVPVKDSEGGSGFLLCLEPSKPGLNAQTTTRVTIAPDVLTKIAYYGYYGAGKNSGVGTINSSWEGQVVITHVAQAAYYSAVGDSTDSSWDKGMTAKLAADVNTFLSKIESLPMPPGGIRAYIVMESDDNWHQDYLYINNIKHQVSLNLKKSSSDPSITADSSCYSLAGARYEVYSDAACTKSAGTLTTDESGNSNTLSDLLYTTYYVKETKAAQGYTIDTSVHTADLSGFTGSVYTLNVTDEPIFGGISIQKKDAVTGEKKALGSASFEGVQFGIYNANSYAVSVNRNSGKKVARGELVDTITTDKNGYAATSDHFLQYGKYTVKEMSAPRGYEKCEDLTVDVSRDGVIVPYSVDEKVIKGRISTELTDDAGGHYTFADGTLKLTDHISYSGFDAYEGADVTFKGVLMDKDGSSLTNSEGNPVTAQATVRIPAAEGEAEIVFTLDAASLAGRSCVAYEEAYWNEFLIAEHKDINDAAQTDNLPKIGTVAVSGEGEKAVDGNGHIVFTDTVTYENLEAGHKYNLYGKLIKCTDGTPVTDSEGREVTESVSFTAESSSGSVQMKFEFDPDPECTGFQAVVFETVTDPSAQIPDGNKKSVPTENGEKIVAEHDDPEDESQIIYITKVTTELGEADDAGDVFRDGDGSADHLALGDENVTVVDAVSYEGLIPGREYTVMGELHIKETDGDGEVIDGGVLTDSEGNEVTSSVTFTPTETDGTVSLNFSFDGTLLKGKASVAFEKIYYNDVQVGSHTDITDEDQTVYIPDGKTFLEDKKGSKTPNPSSGTKLVDHVSYAGLIPGRTYKLTGTLMDKSTGKEVTIDGSTFTADLEFVPDSADGTVDLEFVFDASDFGGRSIVAFERCTCNDREIFIHEDLSDADQTVTFRTPAAGGSSSGGAQTGDLPVIPFAVAAGCIALCIGGFYGYHRKK